LREKTFTNLAALWLFTTTKFGGVASLAWQKRVIHKVFSAKIVFFTNSRKFSPLKVSRYTVAVGLDLNHRHALIAYRGTSVTTTPIQHIPQNSGLPGSSQSVPPTLFLGHQSSVYSQSIAKTQ